MTKRTSLYFFRAVLFALSIAVAGYGQSQQQAKRTTTKTDRFDFGAGGTVTITGAPNGSIRVVGGAKNEIEIVAEIAIDSQNDGDVAKLAEITGFVADVSTLRAAISSIGAHNKFGLKKLPKNFPKNLAGIPFRIDYTITVPRYTDLEIDGGRGDLSITGVQGSMRVNFLESNANVEVSGDAVLMIGSGSADIAFGVNGWRARPANIQVANGDLSVKLPVNASAEIDAVILRSGAIGNSITALKPRDRKAVFTDKNVTAKIGVGGPTLKFTVGDGNLKLLTL